MSTFERNNLFPYVLFNETDIDKKMNALISHEKKFLVSTKKVKEKLYFNIISIINI